MKPNEIKFLADNVPLSGISTNVDVHLIQITEDRLRNILVENQTKVAGEKDWIAPLGLLLSFLMALVTSDPKDIFEISSHTWRALFIGACFLSFLWLLLALKNRYKSMSVDELIKKIKNN